ncbi:MAG: hypothetical protein AVDCRST_MAG79-1755 [uncultured Thermoleophilia bacterium]|uniref:Uncharacterized protein n=1 Tax=uncultured Thermoleophilia bacterium TaxID=1497501 RepID=A0A6J4U6Y4_9ACTN|nr:MAG: hypothetical protein AVDCRST_MAG79-1755 [uncultured Thermoleophilia bacterium]
MDAPKRLALVTDRVQRALVKGLPTDDLRRDLDHAFAETLDVLDAGEQDEDTMLYRFELVAGYGDLMRSLDECEDLAA